jgi:hypothetical protein
MEAKYLFQYTEEHLLTSVLRYRSQVWWRRPFLGLKWALAILVTLPLLIAAYMGSLVIVAIPFGILITLAMSCPLDAWLTRKRFRKSPFHNENFSFVITSNGVFVTGQSSEVRLGWTVFTKARRFKDGLLLFQGPNLFNWLPDSAATDDTTIKTAQALVRSAVNDYRDI